MQIKNNSKIQIDDINKNIRYGFGFNNNKSQESEEILNEHPQITTKVDTMAQVLTKYGKIEITELCRLIGLERDVVDFYVNSLEKEGLVELEVNFFNVYVVATKKLVAQSRNDLIEYINQCLEKKVAVKKIRGSLLKAGWGSNILDCVVS